MPEGAVNFLLEAFWHGEDDVAVVDEERHEHCSLLQVGSQGAHQTCAERVDQHVVVRLVVPQQQ